MKGLLLTRGRAAGVLLSPPPIVIGLYGLGFVYLKSYLAVFGFQVELASLSVTNLMLAHRFFVAHHFMVVAGVLQRYAWTRIGRAAFRADPVRGAIALAAPWLLVAAAYGFAAWSEPNVVVGFDPNSPWVWAAMVAGWVAGWALFLTIERVVRAWEFTLRNIVNGLLVLLAFGGTLSTYRAYSVAQPTTAISGSCWASKLLAWTGNLAGASADSSTLTPSASSCSAGRTVSLCCANA